MSMNPRQCALIFGCIAGLGWVTPSFTHGDIHHFVERESAWRFFPGTREPTSTDLPAWRQLDFDDGSWASGNAVFGYGRQTYGTDLSLLTPPMRHNYSTLYLRQTFDVRDADRIGDLRLRVLYDDAVIVWINGQEVTRLNTTEEAGAHTPYDATSARTVDDEEEVTLERELLQSGTNVIAAQVLNSSLTNADLRFDLELLDRSSPDFQPPATALLVPPPNALVSQLTEIQVTFDEPVLGIDASDILVAGQPATRVTGSGAGPYRFDVIEPAPGEITIEWSTENGIADAAPDRNSFAGGSWTIALDPTAPPSEILITEFMAANGNTLRDEDGDDPDWIEVWNHGPRSVDISGWSLSDSAEDPSRFIFPAGTLLGADSRLIVFASRKDRSESGGELHAAFSLSDEGEFLGLFNARFPRDAISIYPTYPPQRYDRSYGLNAQGEEGYFETPTPGETNAERVFGGFAPEPRFSVDRGFHDEGFDLELTVAEGHQIIYTLDGADPLGETGELDDETGQMGKAGQIYDASLPIDGEPGRGVVLVRAASLRDDLLPSRVVTHSYLFADEILTQPKHPEGFPDRWGTQVADYELNPEITAPQRDMALDGLTSIPTLSIATHVDNLFDRSRGVYANPSRSGPGFERPVSAELIYDDGRRGFQADCGIRSQGGSSTGNWKSRKVSLRLLFKGEYGPTMLEHPLYPDYDVRRFNTLVLDAGLNLTLNHPGHDQRIRTQNIRDQFMADMQNEAGGFGPRSFFVNLYLNGLHWGVYGLHERPDSFWAAEKFGGEPDDYDAIRHNPGNVVDGTSAAYQEVLSLLRMDLTVPANYELLGQPLDIDNFIKYMIVNIYGGNTDWAHQNWYATQSSDLSVPLRYHSWDAEHVLKGVRDNVATKNDSGGPTGVLASLRANPEFRLRFADWVHQYFSAGGIFYVNPESPEWDPNAPENNRPASFYMRRVREIESAILLEYARWGDNYGRAYTRDDWLAELNFLLSKYFPERSAAVLAQLKIATLYPRVPAPVFDRLGGEIEAGSSITLSVPPDAGVIYYTTNGTDPRVPLTSEISPSAASYTAPVLLSESGVLQARTRATSEAGGPIWSALQKSTFRIVSSGPPLVVISEVMYHPSDGDLGEGEVRDRTEFEFLEILNPGTEPLDLAGMAFTGGVRFTFPADASLAPGEYGVIVADPQAFEERYGDPASGAPTPLGRFMGQLDNGGERVELETAEGETLVTLRYADGPFWPLGADGLGFSLIPVDPLAPNAALDDPRAWRQSAERGGSPGAADAEPVHGGITINEIAGGGVELLNLGSTTIDIGGWFLSDSRDAETSLKLHRLAPQSVPAGGYAVVEQSAFAADLALAPLGGFIYLASAAGETLTGHVVGAPYGPTVTAAGASFGSHETSTALEYVALSAPTLGAENAAPLPPRVAINEIYYHPHEDDPLGSDGEFLELYNPTNERVDLTAWRLEGLTDGAGGSFVFPSGTVVPGNGYLVLTRVDPESYRQTYGLRDAVVVGPYGGGLSNAGESLVLSRPLADGATFQLVDRVVYDDRSPWPERPDGQGPSLERIATDSFGNEVLHWDTSRFDGGTPGARNTTTSATDDGRQVPGDLNQDGRLNLVDAIDLLRHLSGHEPFRLPCGDGLLSAPGNLALLDANGDARVDLSDASQLLGFLFMHGAAHSSGVGCLTIATCPSLCAP